MVDVVQSFQVEEDKKQIASFKPDYTEKVVKTYRELKKTDTKPLKVNLFRRHNYFLRFPDDLKTKTYNILYGDYADQDAVDLVCKTLQIPYAVEDVNQTNLKTFILQGDYDCVIMVNEKDLWPRIVKYLKVMFNFEEYS